MKHKIGLAHVCLQVSALLYLLVGLLMMALSTDPEAEIDSRLAVGILVLCLVVIVGIEIVAYGLHRRKFWAWVAGLCIFAIYLPSLFLPLGALGFWGLLDRGSRSAFGVGAASDS